MGAQEGQGAGNSRPIFSHDLPLRSRDYLAKWIRTVRRCDDDSALLHAGIIAFTNIGRTPAWDHSSRRYHAGMVEVIDRRRAALARAAKEGE